MFLISYYTTFMGFTGTNVGKLSEGSGYPQPFQHQAILVRLVGQGRIELLLLHHIKAGMHKDNIDKNVLMGQYKLLEQKVNNIRIRQP